MARGPGQQWSKVWLAVAALGALAAGAAETNAPRPAPDLTALTEPLLASIAEEEARNGPFSRDLIDLLTSLGLAYQEVGEHVLAVAVLDRALYLTRVNDGLFTLDQAALVQRLIDSEYAIGRPGSADELEKRLLELARRNPGDARGVPIFREAAERNLADYERYLRGELTPEFTITINETMSPQRAASSSVWRARHHYNEAIAATVRNGEAQPGELAELEQALTRTYYLEASARRRAAESGDLLYRLGIRSYHRRLWYMREASPTAVDFARALVELADWSLMFSRNSTAVRGYEQAHALLVGQRVPAASIAQLFPTDVPVFLPAFEELPLRGGGAVEGSTDYIDVDFEVGRYGQPRRVSIVAVAGDDAAATSKHLAAAINGGRFRPSLPAGPGRWTEYRLRYSLADGTFTPRL